MNWCAWKEVGLSTFHSSHWWNLSSYPPPFAFCCKFVVKLNDESNFYFVNEVGRVRTCFFGIIRFLKAGRNFHNYPYLRMIMAPNHGFLIQNNMTEPVSRTYQYRKVMKPMLERKRRARINRCLDELKELMTGALQTVSSIFILTIFLVQKI